MTPPSAKPAADSSSGPVRFSPVAERFILHWGEMGTKWGVNRTVAQIHALLYISPRPLNAEEITEVLKVARSNVSTSLRELQGWGIVRVVNRFGDRKDYFESLADVWEMFRIIIDERKKREADPTIAVLRECAAALKGKSGEDAHTRKRIDAMLEFFEAMSGLCGELQTLPTKSLVRLANMGAVLRKMLTFGKGGTKPPG